MPDRIIRESSCLSETLNSLTDFEERFWWRLIVNCDDYGRFDARPRILKGRLFPLADGKTHTDMQNALNKLASVGLVELYEVDGRPFLHVVKWEKYQRIRAKRSKFPASPASADICCQMTSNVPVIQSNPCEMRNANADIRASAFDEFWAAYPKKKNKIDAKKAFDKVKVPLETLLDAIERQKQSDQWRKDGGQYIPYPATWLNRGAWEDEPEKSGRTSYGKVDSVKADMDRMERYLQKLREDVDDE